jgi:hypothetical protein
LTRQSIKRKQTAGLGPPFLFLIPLLRCHCEERSDEAIHVSACGAMDCFAEPVIGRALARPVGSQ